MEAAPHPPIPIQALSSHQRSRVRKNSKLFFGNQDRMEVLVAIALSPDGMVNATDLQWEVGIVQSRVRNQLLALARVGLLAKLPQPGGKSWYKRLDSPIWQASLALYEDWTG